MNETQKDRLLKLAENNPELAKDVVEILKEEKHASNAPDKPVAVTIFKPGSDKIMVPISQKRAVQNLIALPCFMLFAAFINIWMFWPTHPNALTIGFVMILFCGIISAVIFRFQIIIPTAKNLFNKYFTCENEQGIDSDTSAKDALKKHFKFW